MTALAEMGVLFLLFRVGLEVKVSDLMRVGGSALLVAILGVILPFAVGWGVMALASVSRIEAIFAGAALVATSVGITAQVLRSKGLLEKRAIRIILAAAVIDDVLGLLVLALVSSMAEDRVNFAALATTAIAAGGFVLLVAKCGERTLHRAMPKVEEALAIQEGQFDLALVLLFALALLAVFVGVAAIVGAFIAGTALSGAVNRRVHDLAHRITELLVPFFLAGIGLHLHLGVFTSRSTLELTLAICAVAVLSKLIAYGFAVWRLGRTDMLRVGAGMIPRGEVGMVGAQIGLSMGVIDKPGYAVVVTMAIITTLVAPPLLKSAYRDCRPGLPQQDFTLA